MKKEATFLNILKGNRFQHILTNILCYALLICIAFLILFPLVEHISGSFMSKDDLLNESVLYIPKSPTLSRYKTAIQLMEYGKSFLNSFMLSALCALLQAASCLLIGYGFARFEFPFRKLLFGIVIFTIIMPIQVIITPLFLKFRFVDIFGIFKAVLGQPLNLLDSYWPFIALSIFGLGFKNGLYIYLFRQFFRGLPRELEEAGLIDGTGFWGIFYRIMLPNSFPMIVTVLLFSFSWQWVDNYYTAVFFKEYRVLSLALSYLKSFVELYMTPVESASVMSAGLLLIILPLVVLYVFLQRFFIQGLERSGIVG